MTLMSGKPLQMTQDGVGDVSLIPTDKYEQAWQAMPEYTSHHVGFVSRLAVPGKWEPEDLSAYLLVFRGTPDAEDEMIRLFIERIKEALEVPILDDWASYTVETSSQPEARSRPGYRRRLHPGSQNRPAG